MQRTSEDLEDRLDVSELIERISVERGLPVEATGRHRLQLDPDTRRSRKRRLAPAIAGVTTVLVATTVAVTLRPGDTPAGPDLDAALVGAASAEPTVTPDPAAEEVPAPEETTTTTVAATSPTTAPTTTRAAAVARKPARPVANDGTQAATALGWKPIGRDEFTGATLSDDWGPYDGPGNDGDGRRTPDAISVGNGLLTIRGDADGNTGGMSYRDDRETGRWEMRARFPKGDAAYHPVLLLWPQDGGSDDGEVDFAETTSAADSVSFFLHHGSGDQKVAEKQIDLTQWHNYAVEVTSRGVTGFLDGQKWFESTDPDTLPRGPVHPVIQLDWFPKGDSPEPSELQVDWMRIYQ
ncbi:MAG: glycoside hydrolase family 16 protein [Pseudonocardia sp.]|nr:glycoside hydrolase family 16 protein [Pseudonocardia sp.]